MKLVSHKTLTLAILAIFTVAQSSASGQDTAEEHPLAPAIRYAEGCLKKVEALPGYEATFIKREIVGNNTVSHRMRIKVRHAPFSVYLYFENPHAGREVIYVDGRNNGKLIAHEAGLLSIAGSMELLPSDPLVMNESRYPITKAGIANAVRATIEHWQKETQYGEVDVKYFKDAKLGDRTCRVIESSHPHPRQEFNNHKVRLWIDSESDIPVRVQRFGFPRRPDDPPPVIEDYAYVNLRTDVRLTDADFDRNNKNYRF